MNWAARRWTLSEVRTSVAKMNWVVRCWTPSEVRTSVTEMNRAARRWTPSEYEDFSREDELGRSVLDST